MPLSRSSIHQLPTQLANQIAAGEVVERPASVIKELLENSLDAAATQIDIDIQAGGTQLIRIRDNGHGIPQDELALALTPHATSKIHSLDDLIHVVSMGFRGEALASIASVSELTLTSHYQDMAWSIKAKEGRFDLTPASHPKGSTVEVNHLFYNTPARRKFLKAERTEYKHVEDVVKRLALARFDVAFNFKHNQRQIFTLPVATSYENKLQRLSRIIGKEFIQSAIQLEYENAGLKLSGWIANADYSRSQSDMQYFFVNGRMIRDKVITHAVRQAFQDTLYPGRFPVYVLQLEMDAEQVDVNVHPTKHEVRFRQGRLIHDFLFYSLREALTQQSGAGAVDGFKREANHFNGQSYSPFNSNNMNSVSESATAYSVSPNQNLVSDKDLNKPLGVAITKLKNNYLLAQNTNGLLVIQLQSARYVLTKQQIQNVLSEEKKLISKPVLIPFSLSLNIASHKINAQTWVDENHHELQQMGFDFAVLGENDIMIRQVPAMLNVQDIKETLKQFIRLLVINHKGSAEALAEIIVNDDFSHYPAEWNNLLRELEEYGFAEDFSHQITDKELAAFFKTS